jgi:hypothetical protein
MSEIVITIVLKVLGFFFEREVLANHPVMKAIMEPKPLKPDPLPSPKEQQGPIEQHYGG